MGAALFNITATGTDVNEVFDSLVEEAIHYYGHSPYNGSISTTSLGREITPTDKLKKALKEGDWNLLDEYENVLYPEKRFTNYIKTISHYEGFSPKWVSDKETVARKKGVRNITKYSIIKESKAHQANRASHWLYPYDTLTEAKREAKKLALDEGESVTIKQHRSNGEIFTIGHMELESDGKKHKTKRTAKTKVYLPVYEFEFFVCAAT